MPVPRPYEDALRAYLLRRLGAGMVASFSVPYTDGRRSILLPGFAVGAVKLLSPPTLTEAHDTILEAARQLGATGSVFSGAALARRAGYQPSGSFRERVQDLTTLGLLWRTEEGYRLPMPVPPKATG